MSRGGYGTIMLRLMALLAVMLWAGGSAMADEQSERQRRAMLEAAASGDVATIHRLVTAGGKVDVRDELGRTPLLLAVEAGQFSSFEALLKEGADINAQAQNKDTPWLLAGALGRTQMLRQMLPRGPDLTIRNRFGGNALIPACERAHVDTVRLLLAESRIDVNHINNLGWTCLLEIVVLGDGGPRHVEVTKLVLAAGADPNIADRKGVTPLAHARSRGQADIARLIAGAGGR
ncbi:MAG: ankyrin repeat domain-containing protein [Hyphomicrobiales bacterium]|nr:ankyrin repeat domain-containing protein [Hyphomicrobiales bacterium]